MFIGFCNDEASAMLGTTLGVGQLPKDPFPDIMLWHCLNYKLEPAVGNALDVTSGMKDLQRFLKAYTFYMASHRRTHRKFRNVPMTSYHPEKNWKSAYCLLAG